jgi:hypothetical protein
MSSRCGTAAMPVYYAALCLFIGGVPIVLAREPAQDPFQRHVLPHLERFCIDCHQEENAKGGIRLDQFADQSEAIKEGRIWLRVRDAVQSHAMPPADETQPAAADRTAIVSWIENDFLAAKCKEQTSLPPVVIRRLNRQEYNNTIRDLLGLDLHLADAFPADDIAFGYDNVGSALNLSPILIEKYLDAAEAAMTRAIATPDVGEMPPIELIGLKTYPLPADKPVEFAHTLKPGRYLADFSLVRVGVPESVPPPRLLISFGKDSREVEAARVQDETVVYRYWLSVAPGDNKVRVSVVPNDRRDANFNRPKEVAANVSGDKRYGGDVGLHVDSMVVKGPVAFDPARVPKSTQTIIGDSPGFGDKLRLESARNAISRFAEKAFRRPVAADEVNRIVAIYRLAHDRGESHERGLQLALTTVLASPRFLFLVEPEDTTTDRPLNDFELASRLSYFLWSSMPDDALLAAARRGSLHGELRAQVTRMLEDRRSDAMVENFAGQWLQLRRLAGVSPDRALFATFDDTLRSAMRQETERFFGHILRSNQSVLDLIDADYTFVNDTLAKHYGIGGVTGPEFRRVALSDHRRGGVLTQASVLTLTSNPNRTSPVKRGQWILQQILGTPPPPPPPLVPKLDDSKQAADASSLRDRMELHRANPQCASCHQQMDQMGFALENFDAIGRWRDRDGEFPVDPAGELAGGRKFADIKELKRVLAATANQKFTRCLIENMLTYALGRGLDPRDYCTVEEIRKRIAANGNRMHEIVFGIVESRAFQYRGANP